MSNKYSGITEHNKAAFDAIIPRVNEAFTKGLIKATAPVFDAELTEKDGQVVVTMDEKDRTEIYEHKPMIIGIKVLDEDTEDKFQIIYFTLGIDRKDTDNAIMYQLIMTDEEEHTITKLSLAFLDDGDDIKVLYGEDELDIPELPSTTGNEGKYLKVNSGGTGVEWATVSAGGTQLYKHTLSSWTGSMLTENNPLVIISTSSTPYNIATLCQMVSGMTPDFTVVNIYDGFTGVKAVALTMGGLMPDGFTRLELYYQYVNNGTLTPNSKVIAEDALDKVTGFTDTVVSL